MILIPPGIQLPWNVLEISGRPGKKKHAKDLIIPYKDWFLTYVDHKCVPRWGLRFTLPGRQSLGLGIDYKELFIPSQQFTQTITENLNIVKLDSHSNAHRRIRGPATNEKDVNFKSLMLICISPFGDGVSNWIFLYIVR